MSEADRKEVVLTMWESVNTLERALEDALTGAPYEIAANVISRKLALEGVELTESERQQLIDHLRTSDEDQWLLPSDSPDVPVQVEITEADIDAIHDRLDEFLSKRLPKLIVTVGEEVAEDILITLHHGWEEESNRQRQERIGFQERLGARWGKPINLLRMLLTVSREFGDMANASFRSSQERATPVLVDVLLRLHARACQVADEIVCLLMAGFSDGAMARWRTLHEIAAVSLLLREHGEAAARRYVDHEVIESARAARDYDECRERLGYEPMSEAELVEVRQAHERAVREYGPSFDGSYGWAAEALDLKKPTLRDIQAAAGVDHLRAHYRLASHNVHANPKGVFFKLGLLDEADVLLAGPSNAGLSDPGQNAAISLTQVSSALGTLEPTMDSIVVLHILNKLTGEVCDAFHEAGQQLERDARETSEVNGLGEAR